MAIADSAPPSLSTGHFPILLLPAELLPHITAYLPYPDLLSLRLSHPKFYNSALLSTNNDFGIRQRVSWLCELAQQRARRKISSRRIPLASLLSTSLSPNDLHSNWRDYLQWRWEWFKHDVGAIHIPGVVHWRFKGFGEREMWECVRVRLKTDEEFLANEEVQKMLRRRRRHEDCWGRVKGGCQVVMGGMCAGPKNGSEGTGKATLGKVLSFEAFAVVLFAVLLYWLWDFVNVSILEGSLQEMIGPSMFTG